MAIDVLDEVAQAVKALWMATPGLGTQDASGFSAGELKATLPSPEPDTYAHIAVKAGKANDYSTAGATRGIGEVPYRAFTLVTLTVRGQYKNASKAAGIVRATFGLNLLPSAIAPSFPGAPTLTMPSGDRFIAFRPQPPDRDPERQPKSGNEIWKAVLTGEVETVRLAGV